MLKIKSKIIIICGATATGKSSFAIDLVKNKLQDRGEIISADSRQVYQGLEYFSGAVLKDEMQGIKHHLVSFLDLKKNFTVFDFKKKAEKIIKEIILKNKTPVLVGGSSFFIESLMFENLMPEVQPNKILREKLNQKSAAELFEILQNKDERRAEDIDRNNKRRVIRAIEIAEEIGFVPKLEKRLNNKYEFKIYYLDIEKKILDEKIEKNFLKRVDSMLEEAEILRGKISAEKFQQIGLAFKFIDDFWSKKITKEKFIELGIKEEQKYAKRQKTFLNKMLKNLEEVPLERNFL